MVIAYKGRWFMNRILKGLAAIVLMICFQMVFYLLLIEPYIYSWGGIEGGDQ